MTATGPAVPSNDALRATATAVRGSMPCSVELPAGAGKTQLVAALAASAAERGERPLILTHTNAGVDVMRRRLRLFGVGTPTVRVETIARWSWDLIRHYPRLSMITAAPEPEWTSSGDYYRGAAVAVRANAIGRVLKASYGLVIVDEYQDCVVEQHELIVGIGQSLPVCVLGDRLQNIFSFGSNVTVSWERDILPLWPGFQVAVKPWRWVNHNAALGQWLFDIRSQLLVGHSIDLTNAPLNWRCSANAPQEAIRACNSLARLDGSVVAIGRFEQDCAFVASRTNGIFGMMEELEGRFMIALARAVDSDDPRAIAVATREFATKCISGVAGKLDSAVARKLARGESVANLKRPGAERQLDLLSGLLTDGSPLRVAATLVAIGEMPEGRLFRREAWRDAAKALQMAGANDGVTVTDALSRVRNRTRFAGRVGDNRVISRPLLIKGLEYDHALVLNAEKLSATELYVALSRGRKSLTVVSPSRQLDPASR